MEADVSRPRSCTWSWSDSWIVVAIGTAEDGVDLQHLIATTDVIAHMIVDVDELRIGVGRLVNAGLVDAKPGPLLALSDEGRKLVSSVKGSASVRVDKVLAKLVRQVPCREGRWHLEPSEYAAAVSRYQAAARKLF